MNSSAHALRLKFEKLLSSEDPVNRAREFEKLLRDRFSIDGHDVHLSPKTASPRQTDLSARVADTELLIEAKWQEANLDIGDIDDLRSRLNRAPSDFIGCIFSMSDYAATAISDVETHRTREILLFNAGEINAIFANRVSLSELIQEKRQSLRVNAKVRFMQPVSADRYSAADFPKANRSLRDQGTVANHFSAPDQGEEIGFILDVPDIGTFGTSAVVRLRLELATTTELAAMFSHVLRAFGLTDSGCFNIYQRSHAWHGFGVDNFLRTIDSWNERYRQANLSSIHHSEELSYLDVSGNALLAITARQRVGDSIFLHSAELEIRMPGLPIDTSHLNKLCHACGSQDAFAQIEIDAAVEHERFGSEVPKLNTISQIVSIDRGIEWVTGVVVRNPFKDRGISMPTLDNRGALRFLSTPAFLICDLDSWHMACDVVDQYRIRAVHAVWMGHLPVLNVMCTWNEYSRKSSTSTLMRVPEQC